MRGNPMQGIDGGARQGSIPAHAGQPCQGFIGALLGKVYPRACGATAALPQAKHAATGLSPRMRGNRGEEKQLAAVRGSIPAHAGQPVVLVPARDVVRVYPRACGATSAIPLCTSLPIGLSPRMRGNLRRTRTAAAHFRSIPAHAGQPPESVRARAAQTVYPRAMRGNHPDVRNSPTNFRSIPAHAGQPYAASSKRCAYEVYPRRMRGNPCRTSLVDAVNGSIPAHAGQPLGLLVRLPAAVYPRACGATTRPRVSAYPAGGLSPRMRGNLIIEISSYI